MQLGQEVLNKISDLLVEIDKPKSPKRKPKVPPREDMKEIYHHDDEQNRLYENYKRLRDRAHEREKTQIKNEISQLNSFRVDNKHSMFLNSRNNLRPIHERTSDIIRDKELSIEKKRTEINLERDRRKQMQEEIENEEAENYNYRKSRSKSMNRVASKQEMAEILTRLTQRERSRKEKANIEKMDYLKEKLHNNKEKPCLSKNTERLWEKRKNDQDLSPNVFERFDKYIWDRKRHQEEFINSIREKETPFKPQISKNSIEIMSRSPSRTLLNKDMERTKSQRCLDKPAHKKSLYLNPTRPNNQHNTSNKQHNISSTHAKSQISLSPYR